MRKESLSELGSELQELARHLALAVGSQEWENAHRNAREAARCAGQLLHRLSAMMDVFDEARAAGEVDRALKRVQ